MQKKNSMKQLLWILLAAAAICCCVFVYLHRRVIRAAVHGDPMPACPHWLPKKLKEACGF